MYVSKDVSFKLKSTFLINEHTYKTKVTTEITKYQEPSHQTAD